MKTTRLLEVYYDQHWFACCRSSCTWWGSCSHLMVLSGCQHCLKPKIFFELKPMVEVSSLCRQSLSHSVKLRKERHGDFGSSLSFCRVLWGNPPALALSTSHFLTRHPSRIGAPSVVTGSHKHSIALCLCQYLHVVCEQGLYINVGSVVFPNWAIKFGQDHLNYAISIVSPSLLSRYSRCSSCWCSDIPKKQQDITSVPPYASSYQRHVKSIPAIEGNIKINTVNPRLTNT